ncbi:MAG: hypothetical protein WC227_04385 [Patescibacteria group bacterium]|jgi:hypothetical protein
MNYNYAVIVIYLCVVLAFVIYSGVGIYHLWRFGYSGDLSKLAIVIYSIVSVAIIVTTLIFAIVELP